MENAHYYDALGSRRRQRASQSQQAYAQHPQNYSMQAYTMYDQPQGFDENEMLFEDLMAEQPPFYRYYGKGSIRQISDYMLMPIAGASSPTQYPGRATRAVEGGVRLTLPPRSSLPPVRFEHDPPQALHNNNDQRSTNHCQCNFLFAMIIILTCFRPKSSARPATKPL
jgi:hypothetical protein